MLSRKILACNRSLSFTNLVKSSSGSKNIRFANTDPPETSNENDVDRFKVRGQFATKEEVNRWRTQPNAWRSKLEQFKINDPPIQVLEFLGMSKEKFLDIWRMRHEIAERESQIYDPKRQEYFGPELGCASFFLYRNAGIKFYNNEEWFDTPKKFAELPKKYQKGWYVEKIDCENMKKGGLRYEGIKNISNLKSLKWFSLKGNKFIDDWAIDILVYYSYKTLQYLDISNCSVTHRGLIALYKMQNLKLLVLDSASLNTNIETVCSLLETSNPNLLIKFI